MPEYEGHLSSYEHTHNQRRKDAKAFHKNPLGKDMSEAQRKEEEKQKKAAGMTAIKLDASAKPGAGFKKGGFKSAGFKKVGAPGGKEEVREREAIPGLGLTAMGDAVTKGEDEEEVENDDFTGDYSFWRETDPGYTYYDPFKPGGCDIRCPCRTVKNEQCSGARCELCSQLGPLPR